MHTIKINRTLHRSSSPSKNQRLPPKLRPKWSRDELKLLDTALNQFGDNLNLVQAYMNKTCRRTKGALYSKLLRAMQDAKSAGVVGSDQWNGVSDFARYFMMNKHISFFNLVYSIDSFKCMHRPWIKHTSANSWLENDAFEAYHADPSGLICKTTRKPNPGSSFHCDSAGVLLCNINNKSYYKPSSHTPQGMEGKELNLDDIHAFVNQPVQLESPANTTRWSDRTDINTNLFTMAELKHLLNVCSPSHSFLDLFDTHHTPLSSTCFAPPQEDRSDLSFLFNDFQEPFSLQQLSG